MKSWVLSILLLSISVFRCCLFPRRIPDEEIILVTSHLDSLQVSMEYRRGYYQGMQEAFRELERGEFVLYGYGLKILSPDPETGLPIKGIAGCVVTDFIRGRADGHNYIIKKHLEQRESR